MAAGDLVTQVHHLEWRGQLLGWPLTAATFAGLSGWLDLPSVRQSDVDRPGRHGQITGELRLSGRVIEVGIELGRPDPTLLPMLRRITSLDEDPVEEPLVIWSGTDEPELVFARVIRRAIPHDHAFSVGHQRALIQWSCTDPLRYSVAEQSGSVGLPSSGGGGLAFPAVFPLYFGSGTGGGQLTVSNLGEVSTWPVLSVTGPVTGPIITNLGTGDQLIFDSTFEVPAGQTLTIDVDNRAVELLGISRRDRLFRAQWFSLPVGDTNLQFTSAGSYDPAAMLTVTWRHAYM